MASAVTEKEMEQALLDWCNQRIRPSVAITRDTDLLGEGYLDSLLVMDLVLFIESQFGVSIDNSQISPRHFGSVRALAELANASQAV